MGICVTIAANLCFHIISSPQLLIQAHYTHDTHSSNGTSGTLITRIYQVTFHTMRVDWLYFTNQNISCQRGKSVMYDTIVTSSMIKSFTYWHLCLEALRVGYDWIMGTDIKDLNPTTETTTIILKRTRFPYIKLLKWPSCSCEINIEICIDN